MNHLSSQQINKNELGTSKRRNTNGHYWWKMLNVYAENSQCTQETSQ